MRVLVCGDRNWDDWKLLSRVLEKLHSDKTVTLLIHGGCRGADSMAGDWARKHGISLLVFLADWDSLGNSAGMVRNKRMLLEGKPELVVAFHRELARSKGTAHMLNIAVRAGIKVMVFGDPRHDVYNETLW